MHFRYGLTRFEAISSLKVNLGKLEMVSVGIVQNMEEMIHIIMQSFKLICEISEPSIGLYYQIKHNLELFIEKDVKTLVRVEKTLPILLHRKPTISILYKNAKTTLKRKILFQM